MNARHLVLVTLVGVFVFACSTTLPVSQEAMIPGTVEIARQHPYSVQVVASGGSNAVVFGSPFVISDPELKSAVEETVVKSRVFQSVVQGSNADFALSAKVATLSKSLYGTDLELEIGWSLVRVADRQVVWRKSIITAASTRNRSESGPAMKSAIAEAARENIARALKAVSGLSF